MSQHLQHLGLRRHIQSCRRFIRKKEPWRTGQRHRNKTPLPQLADIKTAVSEAVTNCIVHAYPDHIGPVAMSIAVYPGREVHITVADKGIGIPDIPQAMEPLFTTGNPEERSGLGFAVMQSFMDKVRVTSKPGKGTKVLLVKRLTQREGT